MKVSFTTVTVRDMEESVKFYTEVLMLKEAAKFSPQPGVNIVFLKDEDNSKIELIEYEGVEKSGKGSLVSIGFAVEDLDKALEMLQEKNIEIVRGPVQVPGGVKFVYILDPNGVEIELIEGFSM